MFPFTARKAEVHLRQKCAEWFSAHQLQLLTYAQQQADAATDVELLVCTVAGNVCRAVCEGRVSMDDILPYTLRSIFNAAARLREQNARRYHTEQCYGGQLTPQPMHPAAAEEGPDDMHLQLCRAVQELPEELAIIITLRIWDDRTFPDIAAQLRLPESTVRSRYTAALRKIKSRISTKP